MSGENQQLFISIDNRFKENLPEPPPCVQLRPVITFFKVQTTQPMLQRLAPAVALLDKYHKPYDVVYTNFVGSIVYEDPWQVAVQVADGRMGE